MSAWTCRHTDGKVVQKIVPPRPRIPWWKGPGANSEEKQEPASDINTALMDGLKVLDPKEPIREADIVARTVEASSIFHLMRSVSGISKVVGAFVRRENVEQNGNSVPKAFHGTLCGLS